MLCTRDKTRIKTVSVHSTTLASYQASLGVLFKRRAHSKSTRSAGIRIQGRVVKGGLLSLAGVVGLQHFLLDAFPFATGVSPNALLAHRGLSCDFAVCCY